jgi:hypothetical protein
MKTSLLAAASVLALTVGIGLFRAKPRQKASGDGVDLPHARTKTSWNPMPSGGPDETAETTRNFLLYFIIPLWTAAGVADWLCHRATHIEDTAGVKETLFHLLMLLEIGVPVLAALFLEITSPVLALMIASFFLHEATSLWDVSYAVTRREVTPIEQHVHSFLEMIPLMALSFVAVLHWPQLKALFGFGGEAADRSIKLKRDPLPAPYIVTTLTTFALLEWLPYLEELWRDIRASHAPAGSSSTLSQPGSRLSNSL